MVGWTKEDLQSRGFLALIVVGAVAGLVLPSLLDVRFEGEPTFVVGVLIFVAVSQLISSRFIVLPSVIQNPDVEPERAASVGYAVASAPAILGVAAALLSDKALVVLPFFVIALGSWWLNREFLKANLNQSDSAFPRL